MARKSIGENNVKFQVVLPAFLDEEISQLADQSDLSKAQYIRRVLRQAVQQRAIYSQEAAVTLGDRKMVKMESTPEFLGHFPHAAAAEDEQAEYKSAAPQAPPPGSVGTAPSVPNAG